MSETFIIVAIGAIGIGIGLSVGLMVNSLRKPQSDSKHREPPKDVKETRTSLHQTKTMQVEKQAPPVITATSFAPQEQIVANRINLNPLDVFARALQPQDHPSFPLSRSIAEQVDEILQEMLETSPLRARAIRLLELPQKGMVVMIGLDQYQGVDAVPDEEIRNLIHSAVVEWERRVSEENIVKK